MKENKSVSWDTPWDTPWYASRKQQMVLDLPKWSDN